MLTLPRRLLQASLPLVLALAGSLAFAAPSQAADTGSISGTVTSKLAGQSAAPYAGASVVLDRRVPNGPTVTTSVTSGANGSFSATGLPDGTYEIRTYPTSYGALGQLGYEYYDNRWSPYGASQIVVSGGAAVTVPTAIELQPIGHVVGRVVDEQGQPLAGAFVSFRQGNGGGYSTTTDANGEYDSLDGDWSWNLIPGSYVMSVSTSGYGIDDPLYRYEELPVTVTAGGTATKNVVMKRQPVAVFTVLDTNGQPLAGAPLGIEIRDADVNNGQWGPIQSGPHETNSTGRYRVNGSYDEYRLFFGTPVGYAGTAVGEYWDNAYALKDAKVLSFLGSEVPLSRSFTVQLGTAPTIRAGAPTVSGTANVGQTLTVNPGSWAPSGVTTSVQWEAFGTPIPGATDRELTLTADLEDTFLSVRVTGAKAGEKSVDVVKNVGSVGAGLPPVTFARPTVTGTAKVGQTLTAAPGDWGPTGVTLAYQWLADGTAIAGATGCDVRRHQLGRRQADQRQRDRDLRRCGVRDRDVRDRAAPAVGTLTTAKPRITGTAKVGKRLSAVAGAWSPTPVTLSYQWFRDGKRIAGSTKRTRTLTKADRGHRLTVQVTGRKSGYRAATSSSARTGRVA